MSTAEQRGITLLAEDHKGMRVDYSGLFKQARSSLARGGKEPALAEMLRQFEEHITELGARWYAGDTAVVDELLQLYCVNKTARDTLISAKAATPVADIKCAARKQGTAGGNAPAECDWPGCGCDEAANKVIDALQESGNLAMTRASADVLREREAHHSREGFTNAKDDQYAPGVLGAAGAAYAIAASDKVHPLFQKDSTFYTRSPDIWPWSENWWKPTNPRRALVKAAALIIAEIEKMDRAAANPKGGAQ